MAIAVGLALVAMLLTLFYVINYRRSVQHGQSTVQVYVAAKNIAAGTSGTEIARMHALKQVSVARRSIVPGAISDPGEVSNLVLTQPLYAGEQVTLRRFADAKAEGVPGQLRGTMRAVQVAGDPNQLLVGTLKAGDHVDVVANVAIESGAAQQGHATRIVLRDINVLQVNQPSAGAPGGQSASVILAVTDTQVQRLFYVLRNDDWTLELRPAINASDSPERIDTLNSILTAGVR
ncbi:MAG TPA: Flp pilus assembly protein CpaB [Gaiellaceae bacterium]|nr:Flp pilus assembly protein CpaB [Gaiellaceae bacterium]